jgi:hypothetical protein
VNSEELFASHDGEPPDGEETTDALFAEGAVTELLAGGVEGVDLALAQGQFEFAKTRYIRTLTADAVSRMVSSTAAQRAKLTDEIAKLRAVTQTRHEAAIERARNYAAVLPHRVGKNTIQAPSPLERVGEFHGSDRLYNLAKKAAHEYAESRELLVKRRAELAALERVLREALADNEALLLEELSSGHGLKLALRRDPLLNMSYERLRKIEAKAKDRPADGLGGIGP